MGVRLPEYFGFPSVKGARVGDRFAAWARPPAATLDSPELVEDSRQGFLVGRSGAASMQDGPRHRSRLY
jgi:hypothetical protein